MHISRVLACTLCLLISAGVDLVACDVCAIYTATQAQGESKRGLFMGAGEQFTHFGTLQSDGSEVANPTDQRLDSSITQVLVGYSFTQRFSLQVNVPFIYRSFERPEGFEIDRGTESGLGDVSLVGNFLVWRKDTEEVTFTWNVLGGIKFPTGDTSRIEEEFHEGGSHGHDESEGAHESEIHDHHEGDGAPESGIHGHDLALGSGSLDGVVGTSVYLRYKRAFVTGSVQYFIRSQGDYDYQFANDLSWEGGPGIYLLLEHTCTLALQVVVSGEHKGTDTFQGESAEDTGITSVFLGPRLSATWSDRLSANVGVDVPVSIDNTALQIVPDLRVRAGFTWRF